MLQKEEQAEDGRLVMGFYGLQHISMILGNGGSLGRSVKGGVLGRERAARNEAAESRIGG